MRWGCIFWWFSFVDGGDAQYEVVFPKGGDRSASRQAAIQLYCIGITLAIAIASGAVTGFILRLPLFAIESVLYHDDQFWEVPGEDENEQPQALQTPRTPRVQSGKRPASANSIHPE
jgi:hypothetical protein